jgi:hypothetical protein
MSGFDKLDISEMSEEFDRLTKKDGGSVLDKFVMMPREGPITVRLLPKANLNGEKRPFFCATRLHKLEIPGDKFPKNIHCTRVIKMMYGKKRWVDENQNDPCPICRMGDDIWNRIRAAEKQGARKQEIDELKKEAGQYRATERYYYNCIIRQVTNPKTGEVERNVGPKILSVGRQIHDLIIRYICGDKENDEPALGDVSDPDNGRDFKIVKRIKPGPDQFPEYVGSRFLEPSSLGTPEQVRKWVAELHDLPSLRRIVSHDDIKADLARFLGEVVAVDANDFDPKEFTADIDDRLTAATTKADVVREAEMELGGSGNKDTTLSDEDFFKNFENIKAPAKPR